MDRTQFNALTRVMAEESATSPPAGRGLLGGAVAVVLAAPVPSPAAARTPHRAGDVPLRFKSGPLPGSSTMTERGSLPSTRATQPMRRSRAGTDFAGPEEIAAYAQSHFAAFPDVALELTSAFAAGDLAAAE